MESTTPLDRDEDIPDQEEYKDLFDEEQIESKDYCFKEIEVNPSSCTTPYKIGFANNESQLPSAVWKSFRTHQKMWDFGSGIVYFSKLKDDNADSDNPPVFYKRPDRFSICLLDADTFLTMYQSTRLQTHIDKTIEKIDSLASRWNTSNKNKAMGQRVEQNYNYCAKSLERNVKNTAHRSKLMFGLNTWDATRRLNKQPIAKCTPSDVKVQIKIKSTLISQLNQLRNANDFHQRRPMQSKPGFEGDDEEDDDHLSYNGWGLKVEALEYLDLVGSKAFHEFIKFVADYSNTDSIPIKKQNTEKKTTIKRKVSKNDQVSEVKHKKKTSKKE